MAKAEWWSKCVALAAYEGKEPSDVRIVSNALFECRGLMFYVATDEEADDLKMPKDREEQGYFLCEVEEAEHDCRLSFEGNDYDYEHDTILVNGSCMICGRSLREVFCWEAIEDRETGELISGR